MTDAPSTVPGWEARGFVFTPTDASDEKSYGFDVAAPDGSSLGSVREDTPEAASAAACMLAASHPA